MLFIVDGTGDSDNVAYAREMANGFCKRLMRKAKGRYWRGPGLAGTETTSIAGHVLAAIMQATGGKCPAEKLYLAGHSRGGAAVIYVAQELKARGMEVEAMFLFDAVERTINFRNADSIPGNVLRCYHAVRDRSLTSYYSDGVLAARDSVAKCVGLPVGRRASAVEDMIDYLLASPPVRGECAAVIEKARELINQDAKMRVAMRSTLIRTADGELSINFGNCGLKAQGQCQLEMESFMGSHGALGGAPIADARAPALMIESDRAAMACVDAWMSARMCAHGLFNAGHLRD